MSRCSILHLQEARYMTVDVIFTKKWSFCQDLDRVEESNAYPFTACTPIAVL